MAPWLCRDNRSLSIHTRCMDSRNRLCCALLALSAFVHQACAESTVAWVVGSNNNSTGEMEHEAYGDDLLYVHPGDYTGVNGYNVGTGAYDLPGVLAATAEPLIDTNSTAIGFERAVVASDPAINLFFQLDAASSTPETRYRFNLETLHSIHTDLAFSFNGQPIGTNSYAVNNRSYRATFSASAVNAAAGGNVLTVLRTGGTAAYLTVDYLRLAVLDSNEVFTIGYEDLYQSEFEHEGGTRNDPNFYFDAGDYSEVSGLDGAGLNRSTPEPFQSETDSEGFPRALVPSRPTVNIFFQLSAEEQARGRLRFRTRLQWLGSGSVHDMEFLMNGVSVQTLNGVSANTDVDFQFDAAAVQAVDGNNVFSVRQNNVTGASPWIQFDFLELQALLSEAVPIAVETLGGAQQINWDSTGNWILQTTTNLVTGPWIDQPAAEPPISIPPPNPVKYYRLKQQP